MNETVDALQLPQQYRSDRPHLFPSDSSFEWFVRQNRTELVQAGAPVRPTGRLLVQPASFDRVILSVGTRRAGAR